MTADTVTIRAARADEAAALGALALRSKGHWGYDAAMLAAWRDDLAVAPGEIARDEIRVAAAGDGMPLGFYHLTGAGATLTLDDLWVEPGTIGGGLGRRLLAHAAAWATARGATALTWTSDPHAAGFYAAMGARRAGEQPSTVFPDRALPIFVLDLPLVGRAATALAVPGAAAADPPALRSSGG